MRDGEKQSEGDKIAESNNKPRAREKNKKHRTKDCAVEMSDIKPGRSFQLCESHLLRDGGARWTGQEV